MANSDQIISLIKSHYDGKPEQFSTLALQIAAHEARQGHNVIAAEIRKAVDKNKFIRPAKLNFLNPALGEMVFEEEPQYDLGDLVLREEVKERITRIVTEYMQRERLLRHHLQNRRKILLGGPSGTGKTMTASVIAHEIELPLYIIRMEKILTKFMGETSTKLGQIFELIASHPGVYLFDEFDAIGTQRGMDNEVGEMRRVLNSFLQFIERDSSESLILAATNNLEMLDQALFRRFDDVIRYALPTDEEKTRLLQTELGKQLDDREIESLVSCLDGLSHSEIKMACMDALKEAIISSKPISLKLVRQSIDYRKEVYRTVAS